MQFAFRSDVQILKFDPFAFAEMLSGRGDALEESGIILQTIIKPIILIFKTNKDSGRFSMSKNNDFFLLSHVEIFRKMILDFRERNFFGYGSPNCFSHSSAFPF